MYRASDIVKLLFVVKTPGTDVAVNADALPTVAAYHDGVADSGLVVTVTNLAAGVYLASATIPSSGYDAFERVSFVASYLVSTASLKQLLENAPIVASKVQIDMAQAVPVSNTAETVGDALNGARAQAFGKWAVVDNALYIYAADGTTLVRTFVLNDSNNPTSRT